jgi:hypothetical protein
MVRTADQPRAYAVDQVRLGRPLGWRHAPLRLLTAPLRALPDFLVIGAMKAGTTSLYHHLRRHPRVLQAVRKEVHHFDQPADRRRDTDWYRAHFPLRAKVRRNGAVTGEATPNYLYRPWIPPEVRRVVGAPKLIAILRDPVGRAISHYGHLRRRRGETRPLACYLDFAPERDEGYVMDAADPHGWGYAPPENDIVARGIYDVQLARWFEVFGREALMVIFLEELVAEPDRVMGEVFDHLGLEPVEIDAGERRNRGPEVEVSAEERARLGARFAGGNARLAELLGRDLPWTGAGLE